MKQATPLFLADIKCTHFTITQGERLSRRRHCSEGVPRAEYHNDTTACDGIWSWDLVGMWLLQSSALEIPTWKHAWYCQLSWRFAYFECFLVMVECLGRCFYVDIQQLLIVSRFVVSWMGMMRSHSVC